MIKSKNDYREYVREDRKALGRENRRFPLTLLDWPLRYQLVLRRAEYFNNCYTHFWQKPFVWYARLRHRMLGNKCGYSIPLNTCGKGLNLAHLGNVVINAGAEIGEYCRIHIDVNIGTAAGQGAAAPKIGRGSLYRTRCEDFWRHRNCRRDRYWSKCRCKQKFYYAEHFNRWRSGETDLRQRCKRSSVPAR